MHQSDGQAAEVRATVGGLLVSLAAMVLLLMGGALLDRAEVGSAIALQEHEGLRIAGLLVVALSGALGGAARIAVDRRWDAEGWVDVQRLWLVVPPLAVLLLTFPAVVGLDLASDLGTLPGLGPALTGVPAAIAAGAAAWAVGLAPTLVLRYRTPIRSILEAYEQAREARGGGVVEVDDA